MVPSVSVLVSVKAQLRKVHEKLNPAVGGSFGGGSVTVTVRCATSVSPPLSVTVSVTSYAPPAA